jgi:hypothetical protein
VDIGSLRCRRQFADPHVLDHAAQGAPLSHRWISRLWGLGGKPSNPGRPATVRLRLSKRAHYRVRGLVQSNASSRRHAKEAGETSPTGIAAPPRRSMSLNELDEAYGVAATGSSGRQSAIGCPPSDLIRESPSPPLSSQVASYINTTLGRVFLLHALFCIELGPLKGLLEYPRHGQRRGIVIICNSFQYQK